MRPKKIVIRERMEIYNLVARVNRNGIEDTAAALECDPTTLTRWLRQQGFKVRNVWELTNTGIQAIREKAENAS